MNGDQDITLGEIHRSVKRIEESMKPLASLPVRVDNVEKDISELAAKVDTVRTQSVFISGLISGGGAVINFLFGRH